MDDLCMYQIEVRDQVTEQELNTLSPLHMTLVREGPASRLFSIQADQSALIGLLRHLHGRGIVLLSVRRGT
ncbi:MAG: hypothetical protein GX597_20025 [Anaerolineaceae bacterium]|jgi:hypothetical protein|nr:hypothetical protein [Anaerolineae bacterium]MDX9831847.1 hypothetical protein [Anaerolineae bacterium]NLF14076.1 hypothetical protein [Anaerolineaceae bacterium]